MLQQLASPPVAASLHDALGWDPGIADVVRPMRQALEKQTGGAVADFDIEVASPEVPDLQRNYGDDSWTWRR